MITITLLVLFSYLLGSIPTGYLIAKHVMKIDIREHGSGNPGAANVYRIVGSYCVRRDCHFGPHVDDLFKVPRRKRCSYLRRSICRLAPYPYGDCVCVVCSVCSVVGAHFYRINLRVHRAAAVQLFYRQPPHVR